MGARRPGGLTDADDGQEAPVPVHFVLPSTSLWVLPVERWWAPDGDSALGRRCPVFVRSRDGGGRSRLRERQTRWADLVRGPLEGRRTGLDSATSRAVPVACVHAPLTLEEGVALGYPLMLWSRSTRHEDCAAFHQWVDELLRESVTVHELLARLRPLEAAE
ncbi:hypothetical protein AB0N14_00815 [Streptomyces sp. NPDC051104]|uniref:VMAP-C domain-containing protein n=1 Tax=Streptomyces sp. NPDC051104 TaxID=3155044 RepID=UPI003417FD21